MGEPELVAMHHALPPPRRRLDACAALIATRGQLTGSSAEVIATGARRTGSRAELTATTAEFIATAARAIATKDCTPATN